jgi:hypothetical protein
MDLTDLPTSHKIRVYRILTFEGTEGNAYTVNRSEDWMVKMDKCFDSVEEAKAYVKAQSIQHTDLLLFGHHLAGQEREAYMNDFCFDDDRYLRFRRYFLGPPPVQAIKKALQNAGIKVKVK